MKHGGNLQMDMIYSLDQDLGCCILSINSEIETYKIIENLFASQDINIERNDMEDVIQ